MAKRSFKHFVEEELGKFPLFLIYAVLEWLLIIVLFIDGFLAFFANEFARFFELEIPCLLCTRIDHVFVRRTSDFYYNDSICESHKKEVSCLAYCHNHKKLSDIRRMCDTCLLSFATAKEAHGHTYKSLVGILNKDIATIVDNDPDQHFTLPTGRKDDSMQAEDIFLHRCPCCGGPLKAKSYFKGKGSSMTSQAPTPSPRAPFANWRNEEHRNLEISTMRYTELKFPDNETELHEDEDGQNTPRLAKEDAKAPAGLTEAEYMNEDRTPIFCRGNRYFGIPLTDSANVSPRWSNRVPRKSPLEKTEFASEYTEGSAPSEADGDLILHQMKGQARLDRKSLMALYMELDEERSASAVAANNAMAMITRLQAEKAAVQMEALQYQRMMEEEAEYDQEALQATYDLLAKREEEIKVLEAELDEYREKYGPLREDGFEGSEVEGYQNMNSQTLKRSVDAGSLDNNSQYLKRSEDEGSLDKNSQPISSNAEKSEHISPACSSTDGLINEEYQHSNKQSSSLSIENEGKVPEKLRKPGRACPLGRLKNIEKRGYISSDGRMNEATGQEGKLMKELLHFHEWVKALEVDDKSSKHAGQTIQNDSEKLLIEISDNLQKLRHFISVSSGDN